MAARLSAVRARIAAACDRAGRGSDEVTLIAVTKTRPVTDIRLLCELGVPFACFGRNCIKLRKALIGKARN